MTDWNGKALTLQNFLAKQTKGRVIAGTPPHPRALSPLILSQPGRVSAATDRVNPNRCGRSCERRPACCCGGGATRGGAGLNAALLLIFAW